MTYAKEPLVIKPTREIPQEYMFSTANKTQCTRDKNKPNRYWFKYPEHWVHTSDKERIIGIRDCYIARTQRHIWFDIHISIHPKSTTPSNPEDPLREPLATPTSQHVIHIDSWMDADKTVKEFIIDLNKQISAQLKEVEGVSFKESHILVADSFYLDDPSQEGLFKQKGQYVVRVRSIPWSNCKVTIDELHYNNDSNDLMKLVTTEPFTNTDDTVLYIPFKWDRYNLYITSSISDLDCENFLCHTDRTYSPIKYYRIHSTDDKFWVDLWSTRNHSVPAVLPEDNGDMLIIEALVCFDSSAMI